MPTIDRHAPGSFCWFELGTSDQNAAKQFYSSLLGWNPVDYPMGPNAFYTMFKLSGKDCAAAYGLDERMKAAGVPPHWMPYIAVESADATAAKVASAGGTVLQPPFDAMTFGRMAVLKDPAGASFSIWEPKDHHGTGITGEPGTFCWADLCVPDAEQVKAFYGAVFGWQLAVSEHDNSGYLHIKNGDTFIGGVPPAQFNPPNVPPHWLLYYYVTDCDASTAKAKELGARVLMGPMDIEKVGKMSVIGDPQGVVFALFTPAPHA